MKYQDELEIGKRSRKPNLSLQEQIQLYRNKLLMKVIGFIKLVNVHNKISVYYDKVTFICVI